jgi:hypothetical protein
VFDLNPERLDGVEMQVALREGDADAGGIEFFVD